jgi:hypothetical protein
MKKKWILNSVVSIGFLFNTQFAMDASAQYLSEVLRVSQKEVGATARFKALGNAQTSLGGDLSSIAGNPAGIGFFNQSDFGFTLDYLGDRNQTTYFESKNNYSFDKVGFNQIGGVFNFPARKAAGSDLESGWLNFNIGMGYYKTSDLNSAVGYAGVNPSSTFVHFLADQRDIHQGVEGDFGWESFLLDYNNNNPANSYHYPSVLEGNNAQKNTINDRGYSSSTYLSFGSNYSNKLYVGASIGLTSFKFNSTQVFNEDGYTKSYDDIYRENPSSEFLNPNEDAYQFLEAEYSLAYQFQQASRGTGVNATLGFIYKPIPSVNIGLSATTPTWYQISDEGKTFMDVWYYDNAQATESFFTYNSDEITDYLDYRVKTPYRLNGGISTLFNGGLIAFDLEYVDYNSMHFSASNSLTSSVKENLDREMNAQIKDTYSSALNLKVGAEYMFAEQILGRIGYVNQGSPYKDADLTTEIVSAGLGYRMGNMYVDLTYQNVNQNYSSTPYQFDTNFWNEYEIPTASIKNMRHHAYLTVGFKF